jgi:hypothetical protein
MLARGTAGRRIWRLRAGCWSLRGLVGRSPPWRAGRSRRRVADEQAVAVGVRSGRVGDAAQPRQRHGERVGPRPAGGQVQPPLPPGAGEPAGQHQQGSAAASWRRSAARGCRGRGWRSSAAGCGPGWRPAARRRWRRTGQRQVRQARARLEVADGQLTDGVAAMVGVQPGGRPDAVGDGGVVPPGREQLLLVAVVADPPDDQAVVPVGGLGDLRDAIRLVGRSGPRPLHRWQRSRRGRSWPGAP